MASPAVSAPPSPLTLSDLRPRPVSGHLRRVKRQSGDRWRVKWRDAAGVEHKRVLGRVWSATGRPREGYLTKQQAQRALDEILAEARRVGLSRPGFHGDRFCRFPMFIAWVWLPGFSQRIVPRSLGVAGR